MRRTPSPARPAARLAARLSVLGAALCCALPGQAALAQPTPLGAAPTGGAPAGGVTVPVAPAAGTPDFGRLGSLALETGAGRVLNLPGAIANVFVADPKVAEVRPASPSTLFVFGAAPGRTTLAAMDTAGHVVAQYRVVVRPSAFTAAEAGSAIARAMPGSAIRVEDLPTGLAISGQVATPADADRALGLAQAFLADKQALTNRLTVASSTQVSLRVRIAEMSRSVSRELGINWTALQGLGKYAAVGLVNSNPVTATAALASTLSASYAVGNTNFSAVLDALAQDNLVHMLAEPNLTTMSGEPASFLVGGEFPVPVAEQNTSISVTFKQYGVNLSFVPTVLGDGQISIHVRPEVSALSNQGAVTIGAGNGSISIPALTVRRADTTVQVGSGDSFAIAGLLQENVTQTVSALPWLGEVPILGPLFRSDSFQRNESELVIIVTPYVVRPVSEPLALRQPDDAYAPPTDLERLLLLRQVGQTNAMRPARIPGAAGWIVQ